MTTYSEVFLSNGTSITLSSSPREIYGRITHSDGKPLDHIHDFETVDGKVVYVNSAHIVSIVPFSSENSKEHESEEKREEKKEDNLEAAQNFKDELGDNME